ncbi:MAG TPA: cob(I)yrinic acid a,c-diamide adenosyltransferase [Syntrophobacteria bacterium]|nr:cob(I)yrinic acid a,c-diamide adenosyltransferase [Syntrophobacteria bacterium]
MDAFCFSKKGDHGETSLLTGERISKASLRPETYGTLDEASSALGIAKALTENVQIRTFIERVQEDLVILGAELACEVGGKAPYQIDPGQTERLERWIDDLQREIPLPRQFIQPGANAVSAALDLARTIIRRAERRAVAMKEEGLVDHAEVHAYLNRLADFLFTLARYGEKKG